MDSPIPSRPRFDLPLFLATVLPALGLIVFACVAFKLAARRPAIPVVVQPPVPPERHEKIDAATTRAEPVKDPSAGAALGGASSSRFR